MRACDYCTKELKPRQKRFCSRECSGLGRRGSGKSHIRVSIDDPENPGEKKREYLHRVVYAEFYRPLEPGEIVHHKNENRFDNSPENLAALKDKAAHLHAHNYYRNGRRKNSQTPTKTELDRQVEVMVEFGW